MAEARAAVNSLRVGSVHLDALANKAKLRGIQVPSPTARVFRTIPASDFDRYMRPEVACMPILAQGSHVVAVSPVLGLRKVENRKK